MKQEYCECWKQCSQKEVSLPRPPGSAFTTCLSCAISSASQSMLSVHFFSGSKLNLHRGKFKNISQQKLLQWTSSFSVLRNKPADNENHVLKIWAWFWSLTGINPLNFPVLVNVYVNVIKMKIWLSVEQKGKSFLFFGHLYGFRIYFVLYKLKKFSCFARKSCDYTQFKLTFSFNKGQNSTLSPFKCNMSLFFTAIGMWTE